MQKIGLAGIYIGTIVSGLIANITRPFIIYKVCFDQSVAVYFRDSLKYIAVNAAALALLLFLEDGGRHNGGLQRDFRADIRQMQGICLFMGSGCG